MLEKCQQILKMISNRLGVRKSLILCFILVMALYLIYSSSDSWLSHKSVSNRNGVKHGSVWQNVKHISLPNLIHRQLSIDSSNVLTITPENLTSLINKSKTSTVKNTSEMFSQKETQRERKKVLHDYCQKYGLSHRIISIWRKNSNNYRGKQRYCTTKNCPILVDEKHKFMFCFVQKIGSTSIKKFFSILSDNKLNFSANTNITAFHFDANEKLSRISPMFYSTKQNKQYLKAIFVRHPFIRLISAFKDKAEKNRSQEPYFYAKYWDPIMKKERGVLNLNNQSKPLFKEFVKLILTSKLYEMDEHWSPIWNRCEPCYVEYDFIGKLETPQDFEYLQKQIKFKTNEMIWENKNWKNITNKEVKKYLLQITAEQIISLYKVFYLDFKLFGYTIEEVFR